MKNAYFWNVTKCGSCKNQRFGVVLRLLTLFLAHRVRWVPCHHSMALPQDADGGTASSKGG
jgi:hypothetical protein